ncbi:alpha/beta hydrolase [Ruegeria sp. HKCCD4884]|uniref:alpha/beta hydrolase n=1 Tax=Ruegeria sp. HKCCD4884 TaxID=2683022 RepID=UPI0014927DF3|nr:alpha/beta hydrolase [Ruegeria sp. HKCCD4884]NOD92408.1 alpha/beta hydrolase [Ruegeria sp. HKCCD4884]
MFSRFFANLVTKTRAPLFDTPANWGLAYEDVEFKTADGVTLRGWLVNPGQDKVIIQSHFGLFSSRAGYTNEGKPIGMRAWPTDIPFLKHIQKFAEEGYTTLAYDLRNCGDSDKDSLGFSSDGQAEYQDVLAAVSFITSHPDYKDAPIGMLNICMGSSSMTLAHGVEGGLEQVDNIKAHVVVQPLNSGMWLEQMRVPGFMIRGAVKYNMRRGGVDFTKKPIVKAHLINKPTIVIQNKNDPFADMDYVQSYYNTLKVEKEMVWTDKGKTRIDGYADLTERPEKVIEWFGKYVHADQPATPA